MLKLKLQYFGHLIWRELTHWKIPWCCEGLGAGGEGDDRGWDGQMASPTQWTGVWVNSGSWWWTCRPDVLWLMGSQRVGHNWATELNWLLWYSHYFFPFMPISSCFIYLSLPIVGAYILTRVVSSSFMVFLLLHSAGLWTQTETITLGFGLLSLHICVGQYIIISLFTYTHFIGYVSLRNSNAKRRRKEKIPTLYSKLKIVNFPCLLLVCSAAFVYCI